MLTIGGYVDPKRFAVFSVKRYVGKEIDPEIILPDVLRICGEWNVHCIGLDWGHGWGLNGRIFKARGRERAMQFAYSHNLGERKRWDADAFKWIINRNAALHGYL